MYTAIDRTDDEMGTLVLDSNGGQESVPCAREDVLRPMRRVIIVVGVIAFTLACLPSGFGTELAGTIQPRRRLAEDLASLQESALTSFSAEGIHELYAAAIGLPAVQMGMGISFPDAHQKAPAFDTAEAEAKLKAPTKGSFTVFNARKVLSSAESYSEHLDAMADVQAKGWGASVKANLETSKRASADVSHLTFSSFGYIVSQEPTVMHGCPKFTEAAKSVLGKSVDMFEEKYGNHFIYGYRAAAYAQAEVVVETSSSEDSRKIEASLSGSFNKITESVEGAAQMDQEMHKVLKERSVSYEFKGLGLTGGPESQTMKSMSEFIFNLDEHRDAAGDRSLAIVYPYSWCPEYQNIVTNPKPADRFSAKANDLLFKVWAQTTYLRKSYDELLDSCADLPAVEALMETGIDGDIAKIEQPISEMMEHNAPDLHTLTSLKTKIMIESFKIDERRNNMTKNLCHGKKRLVKGCSKVNTTAQYGAERREGCNQVAGEAICCDDFGRCTRHIRDGEAWFLTAGTHQHCTTDSTVAIVPNQDPPSYSYEQARAICQSVGWRLPKNQAEVDSTCGTGCQFDSTLVWIDWECDENTNVGLLQDGYRGCQDRTVTGRTCQKWRAAWQTAHPNMGLGDHNYCRNPDHEPDGIWCYTDDGWGYCNPL